MATPLTNDEALERLAFAERRCSDLLSLIDQGKFGAEPHLRQQLAQEFFFHLVGTADLLAQLVSEKRGLAIDVEDVSVSLVAEKLDAADPLAAPLKSLFVQTRRRPLPADPYSEEGYLFRIYNYRHQVTHRRRNPFNFRVGAAPSVSFVLDPRDSTAVFSEFHVREELRSMLCLMSTRCKAVLSFC